MSDPRPTFAAGTKELQRRLAFYGFNPGPIDGIYGTKTAAARAAFDAGTLRCQAMLGAFDLASERLIAELHPATQVIARQVLKHGRATGEDVRVVQGLRTFAEQDRLYAIGRNGNGRKLPGKAVVTNAKGGSSFHNYGLAIDIGIFSPNGRYIPTAGRYDRLAAKIAPLVEGEEWGGNWRTIHDAPHWQPEHLRLTETRLAWEDGKPVLELPRYWR